MFVTLLGRSNVGKSSLFNALSSQNGVLPAVLKSIVEDKPGTTRDAKYGKLYLRGRRITLVDTGGIESLFPRPIYRNEPTRVGNIISHIEEETIKAVKMSDMILFVVDGREGVTPLDMKMAQRLHEWSKQLSKRLNVNLVVNKLDNEGSEEYYEAVSGCVSDCYSLELGDPLFVSIHNPNSIKGLRDIICRRLNIAEINSVRNLEELAIIGGSVPEVYGGSNIDKHKAEKENDEFTEIDKSIRVCSTTRNSFAPSDRWIRLLNNVCDTIPFSVKREGNYAIPSVLSPAEKLAKMYISKDTGNVKQEKHGDQKPNDQKPNDESHETEEVPTDSSSSKVSNEAKHKLPMGVRPLRVLLIGTVEGFQNKLAKLLSAEKNDPNVEPAGISESLSPNWHKFYGVWNRQINLEIVPQPVELYSAAALNLGGSLGKVSSIQTNHLIRKADIVLMCAKVEEGRSQNRVHLSKKETAWISRINRLHKPIVITVEAAKEPQRQKLSLGLASPSQEFDAIPILSLKMPENRISGYEKQPTDASSERKLRRLKREIISLIDRGETMVETSKLNRWLRVFLAKWPPPWHEGSRVNVKFAAQVRGSPPTFVMWSNVYGSFPQHYLRKLKQAMSEEFNFKGVPLKFILRTTAEPAKKSAKGRLMWKRKVHSI